MGLFKRHKEEAASIELRESPSKNYPSSHWSTNDIVEGTARFRLPSHLQDVRFSVTLKGVISTSVNETPHGSLQPKWKHERLNFLSVRSDQPQHPTRENGYVKVPFRFDLSSCQLESALDVPLPPSLDSKHETSSHASLSKLGSDCAYDVSYSITASALSASASALSASASVASATKEISIIPTGQDELPSYDSLEAPGECFLARTDPGRSYLSGSKLSGFAIDAMGQEPAPLLLPMSAANAQPSTQVELVLKLTPQDPSKLSGLPKQVSLKTQLVPKTRITPGGAAEEQLKLQGGEGSHVQLGKGSAQQCTLPIPDWQICEPDGETPSFAIAGLGFLFRLPEKERPCPTFSTPILSRDYALKVKVSFPEESHKDLVLQLPVKVTHECPEDSPAGGREREMPVKSCV